MLNRLTKNNGFVEVETKIYEDTNPSSIDRYVIENNPFRYKGYYYDNVYSLRMIVIYKD